jgi:hypothetical protein
MPQAVTQWLDTLAAKYGDDFTVQLKRDGSGRIKHAEGADTFGSPAAAIGPVSMLRYRITLWNKWNTRNKLMTVTCRNRQEGLAMAEAANPGWTFVRAKRLKEGEQ